MTNAPYQVMPPLAAEEYEALKADIAARGVQVPVEYDENGAILDGHHRVRACGELGIDVWPRLIRYGLIEEEKLRHARRLNLDRRHLTGEQRRALIADDLRERPDTSNRAIAAGLGVDDKTVASVRAGLESTAEIPQLSARKGRDGKARRIVQYVDPTPAGIKGTKLSAKAINEAERSAGSEARRGLARNLSDKTAALSATGRKFPVIYADPAWSRKAGIGDRAYENHYGTMPWDNIIRMPVARRALPDAWLFLWIPRAHVLALHPTEIDTPLGRCKVPYPLASAVAQSWGFDAYSTAFIWTKTDEELPDDHGLGLIAWDQDELLLLFKRGRGLPKPETTFKYGSNHRERPARHSAKPAFYRDMINDMTRRRTGEVLPVLELFAREDDDHVLPPNFYTWGNQSKNTAEIECDEAFDSATGEIESAAPHSDDHTNASVNAERVPESKTESIPENDGLDIPTFLRLQKPEARV